MMIMIMIMTMMITKMRSILRTSVKHKHISAPLLVFTIIITMIIVLTEHKEL